MAEIGVQAPNSAFETLENIRVSKLNNLILALFVNDIFPDENTVLADFIEASFLGYSSIAVSNWSGAAAIGSNTYQSSSGTQTFTADIGASPQDIYGWYLHDTVNLWSSDRDPNAPYQILPGANYRVTVLQDVIANVGGP